MSRFQFGPLACGLALACAPALSAPPASTASASAASLPSDTPAEFKPAVDSFDYIKREEMIAMRDGVKLKTFILIPKGASHAPMLLTRTPYNASERVMNFNSPHLAAAVPQMDDTAVAAGYIIVFQDVRGKYGSEGDYVMTRPARPAQCDYRRSRHRHLRHDRLAHQQRAAEQRSRRYHRRLL